MWQGEILLNRLSDIDFSKKVMEAAQANEQDKVNELIQTIEGKYVPAAITYALSGVIIKLESPAVSHGSNFCTLDIILMSGNYSIFLFVLFLCLITPYLPC